MGGIFQTIETAQPNFEGKSTEQKVDIIINYLFMLREQLDYALCNLDSGNFNETGLAEITGPIYAEIKDAEGSIAELEITAANLTTRITNAEGDISSLEQTASSLTTRVTNAEGDISSLQQTATSLTTRITNAEGDISTLQQTATSLTTRISNAEGDISSLEQTATSLTTRVSNAEGDISTLEQTATSLTTRVGNAEGDISTLTQTTDGIMAQVTDGQGNYTVLNLKSDGLHIGDATGTVTIAGSSVQAGSLVLTDNITFNGVSTTASGAASDVYNLARGNYSGGTFIDGRKIYSPEINANVFNVIPEKDSSGYYSPTGSYNIYGAFGRYVSDPSMLYHFLSIAYSGTDLSPHVTFSSPGGSDVRWRFVETLMQGPITFEDDIILVAGTNYGTLTQRGQISSPAVGQLFFVEQS